MYSSWFLIFTILLGAAFFFIIRYYGKKGIETNVETSNEKYNLVEWFQQNSREKTNAGLNERTETQPCKIISRKEQNIIRCWKHNSKALSFLK